MIVLGVDPGVSGAIAFYYPGIGRIAVHDVPVAGGEISGPHLASIIKIHSPILAVIERVSAMPGNGAVSMFNFGRAYGDVRGVIGALNIPVQYVSPTTWKKYFGLSKDKDLSRKLAIQRFPAVAESFKLKKHDGRAEAALIALYGAEVLMNRSAA